MLVRIEELSPAAGTRRMPPAEVGTSKWSPNAGTGREIALSASGPAASITERAADVMSAQVW